MPTFTLAVNGKEYTLDVDADTPLLWVLREELELKRTKFGKK
jgi:isoquinoline 1-oxidoreductase alpha subunit